MIRLENIRKTFPGFTLGSLDLHVARGEFFVLIGPTGAGKSLVLESVIGMVAVDAGRILLDGRDVTGWPPERRGIGIVYQDQALFPHLSVAQNIAPPKARTPVPLSRNASAAMPDQIAADAAARATYTRSRSAVS